MNNKETKKKRITLKDNTKNGQKSKIKPQNTIDKRGMHNIETKKQKNTNYPKKGKEINDLKRNNSDNKKKSNNNYNEKEDTKEKKIKNGKINSTIKELNKNQLIKNSKKIEELNHTSIKKQEQENKLLKEKGKEIDNKLPEENEKEKQNGNNPVNDKENLKRNEKEEEEINKQNLIKMLSSKIGDEIKIKECQIKIDRSYDIKIKMESLNELINGWEIKYGVEMNKYIDMINKEILLIGILGLKNRGKSYILSKLLKENEYKKEENNNLYLKYIKQKNLNYGIIDTPGINKYIKKYNNKNNIKELKKYNNQIDNFIINFILKNSNFILCVVGLLDYNEQKFINKLKLKNEEYNIEYKQFKKIYIIHNLKEISTKNDIIDYINNVLLITFNLIEKEGNLTQNILNNNTKYYIEKNNKMEIYHLIIAKENTEAGNYYNESTYTFIIQQYNSFHSYKKFDIIKSLKEEIKFISKDIFTKEIKSLDDFENINNKIKLKNGFYIYNNLENNNNNFSYITLKPKYSYYKINNNSQLLIIIEMPGQIIDQKFTCNKTPKNGYYIMTFSGKKVSQLPDNIEEQKKNGSFFSNIDNGEFTETIKINVDKYQLKSNKYKKMEEEKGIYKYYFQLIEDNDSSEEEII